VANFFADPISTGKLDNPFTRFSDPLGGIGAPVTEEADNFFSTPREPIELKQTPYEAGQDAQQALWGTGLKALWEAGGGSLEDIDGLTSWVDEQKQMSEYTDLDGFWDKLQFATGQVSVGAIPAIAATLVAPLVGTTVATGALVTGTIAEALSGIGEVNQKAMELDPEYKASAGNVFAGAAQGAVGIPALKRFTPALKPMLELLEDTGKGALTGTQSIIRASKKAGVTAVASGVTEAVQDVSTSLAAHALTDTAIDSSKARAMGAAALDEFAIGSILGGGVGVISSTSQEIAERQAAYDIKQIEEAEGRAPLDPLQDHTGELDPDAIIPVSGATKSPGTWNLYGTQLFGKSTDFVRKKFADNKYVQTFVQQIHSDPTNPQVNLNTVNEEAAVVKGNLDNIGSVILDAPAALVEEAGKRRVEGKADLSNPIDQAMTWLYDPDQAISSEYNRVGRGNVDQTSFQWNDKGFLPNNNRVNWEKIRKTPKEVESWLVESMKKAGRDDKTIKTAINQLRHAIREQEERGTQLYEGYELDNKSVERLNTIVEDGKDVSKKMRKFIKNTRAELKSLQKSPLNLSRAIPEAPQVFWEKYNDKGVSLKDAIATDLKKKSEHLAYADKFGFNNEVAFELIAQAVIESNKKGNTPMKVSDVDGMMDILRLQQRLPTKRLDAPLRRAQLAVKSYTGSMILGASALMSIPETIITGYKTNIKSWAVGTYRAIKDGSKESQRESLASMEDIGHGWEDATSLAAARIGETVNDMPKAETWFINKLTGLPQVQFMLGAQSLKSSDYYLRRQVDTLADLKTPEPIKNNIKRQLYQFGVKPEEVLGWKRRGYKKTDDFYNDTWIPKLYRELRTTIVEPHPVDKPIWMGKEHWALVSQLKSFVFTFQNLVLNDSYKKLVRSGPGKNRELVMRAAPYLAMYILAQAGIMNLKELMRTGEIEEDSMDDKILRAIGQQGMLSILSDSYHAVSGRGGLLESTSPAAGFIKRQIQGDIGVATAILEGKISPEEAITELIKLNTPTTLADPFLRPVMEEVLESL